MILQFKGVNNVWCYEEAEQIRWANVWIGSVIKDYREGGEKWNLLQNKIKNGNGLEDDGLGVKLQTEMKNRVDDLIRKETNCGNEVVYYADLSFIQSENVCVVTLGDRHKNVTYVFEEGVYLLNGRGQTVQRLA